MRTGCADAGWMAMPESDRAVYTSAPIDYDYGWTSHVKFTNWNDLHGNTIRVVRIPEEHADDQILRYRSGGVYSTMTLGQFEACKPWNCLAPTVVPKEDIPDTNPEPARATRLICKYCKTDRNTVDCVRCTWSVCNNSHTLQVPTGFRSTGKLEEVVKPVKSYGSLWPETQFFLVKYPNGKSSHLGKRDDDRHIYTRCGQTICPSDVEKFELGLASGDIREIMPGVTCYWCTTKRYKGGWNEREDCYNCGAEVDVCRMRRLKGGKYLCKPCAKTWVVPSKR